MSQKKKKTTKKPANFCDELTLRQKERYSASQPSINDWQKPLVPDNLKTDDLGFSKQKKATQTEDFIDEVSDFQATLKEK